MPTEDFLKPINDLHVPGETCPACKEKSLNLIEQIYDVPYFGKAFIYVMRCDKCGFNVSDVEFEKKAQKDYEIDVDSLEKLNYIFVKSASAVIKIPRIVEIKPSIASEGYITTIEGLLLRVRKQLRDTMESSDDKDEEKKLKNMIKKINNILVGRDSIKIKISDPNGNSGIYENKKDYN
jgi:zinc finger protein